MAHFFQKTIVILILTFLFWGEASASSLYFSPSRININENENFTVSIYVSAEISVNAVQGVITFPTDKLGVLSVERNAGSIIDLWVRNPSFSNAGGMGNVTFEGVVLNPGYTGARGKILDIVFRAKREGTADLNFKDFAILANDGQGTNISGESGVATFKILQAKPVPQILREIGESPPTERTLVFWETIPRWVQVSIFILMGVAALVLALIISSFGLVVVAWILSNLWRRRKKFLSTIMEAGKELKGDVSYAARELEEDLEKAQNSSSLDQVIKEYLIFLKKTIRRFFTKNSKIPSEADSGERPEDEPKF